MKWIYGPKNGLCHLILTNSLIFSNRSVPENLDFSFNGKSVPITTSHKHLGVTFSNDAKWNNHVDNIKSSVSKHLNILRKLKYRLSRTNLDKHILCTLDHFLNMHVNYGITLDTKTNNSMEAARIVTGLPIFTKTQILYRERLGLLSARRKRLQLFI